MKFEELRDLIKYANDDLEDQNNDFRYTSDMMENSDKKARDTNPKDIIRFAGEMQNLIDDAFEKVRI